MADPKDTAGTRAAADMAVLLKARVTGFWVVSREEPRAERGIFEAAAAANMQTLFWDCARGITRYDGTEVNRSALDPAVALNTIRQSKERQVWVLRDFPAWLRNPATLRGLRSLTRDLALAPVSEARAVVVLTPSSEIPPELSGQTTVIDWPLPDRTEIGELLDARIEALPEELKTTACQNGTRDAAIDAAVGLTEDEATSCYNKSLVQSRKILPSTVAGEKKRVITREKVLEWYDPLPQGLAGVGGLDVVKSWIMARRVALTAKARAYGLPALKGILLLGIPGCGKSLTAKAIATVLGTPLLRLDLNGLKDKFVGASEGNLRKALKVAEAVSPVVLWVDEIEKALSGATQGAADGGVSADALGTLLSWMQERQGQAFVIATANDVRSLPPELLRKGRFDEIFFVDLPTRVERREIIAAAIRSHGRDPKALKIGLDEIALATPQFTGAEVAALVPDAMFAAFADGEREITTADLLAAAATVVPLAKTQEEKITALREWAAGRARPATSPDQSQAAGRAVRALEL